MKSMNDNSFKTSLREEDVNLSTFRKRNKILILVFLSLIISLTLILGVLITYLVHNTPLSDQPLVNPAVEAFCRVADNTPSCLKTFSPMISPKARLDPNQVFTLTLQTSAKKLENVISFLSITSVIDGDNKTVVAFKNCSNLLRTGSGHIRDVLKAMRVDPFVETRSDEQRAEMMSKIMAVEENLRVHLDGRIWEGIWEEGFEILS